MFEYIFTQFSVTDHLPNHSPLHVINYVSSLKHHSTNSERPFLTNAGPLPEGHEWAEDAMNELGTVLDWEASLQL